MDAIELLTADHREVAALLHRIDGQDPADPDIVSRVVVALSVHDAIEREHFYPVALERLDDGLELVRHHVDEHGEISTVLAEIDRRPAGDARRAELLAALPGLVGRHVSEEETTLFPFLRARMPPAELERLGAVLAEAKAKAPTRPHPHVPDYGVGTKLAARLTAPLDHGRDLIAGRRSERPEAPRRGRRLRSIYQLLAEDHREVEDLLAQLTADPADTMTDGAGRKQLVGYLVAAESRHEAAEEMVLWPAVRRRVPGGKRLSDTALAQEKDARYILDALRVAPDEGSRRELSLRFAEAARAHIAFEENEVWPALQKASTRIGAFLLGLEFAAAARAAPTRPHPHGPNHPLGLATTGTAAATMDRVVDKATGRPT